MSQPFPPNPQFVRPSGSATSSVPGARREQEMASLQRLVLEISDPAISGNAIRELSKKTELFQELAPLLWNSFGTIAVLLQEIVSVYPVLSPPTLTNPHSSRVCDSIVLFQCLASHPNTRVLLLTARIPIYVYPFLDTTIRSRPFENLRLASLGLIGTLVKANDTEVLQFLLSSEVMPLCLRSMEMGCELSKAGATCILHLILLYDMGLNYICEKVERFFEVDRVLFHMVAALAAKPAPTILIRIIRCYIRLSDDPRARVILQGCVQGIFLEATFRNGLHENPTTRECVLQLIHRTGVIHVPAFQAAGGSRSYASVLRN